MSKATKRKHVTKEVLDDYYVPEENEEVAKVMCGRGNNLHEVETCDGRKFLASMPTKFRKNVWIKRGDFVVITPITEGNKVQAEIVYVLYARQIKFLKEEGLWPKEFESNTKTPLTNSEDIPREPSASEDEDNNDLLMENPNRPKFVYYDETDSSSEEESGNNKDRPP